MSNSFFKFKQFTVCQDLCAMKVGTDGVLLAAWADISANLRVLDIGTGTGLIALICAQRVQNSSIDAIDIDKGAYLQAKFNFNNSCFKNRINAYCADLKDFKLLDENKKYNHIICNPPFFKSCLLPSDKQRSLARHDHALSLDSLLCSAYSLSEHNSKLSLILPYDRFEEFSLLAEKYYWFVSRKTIVFPTPSAKPKRILIELAKTKPLKIEDTSIVIEQKRHVYTKGFTDLVKPFYLYL